MLPFVYTPVAVNCCVRPSGSDGETGVTSIDMSAGPLTVNVVDPLMLPAVAVIVVLPCATEVASPRVPGALLTVAVPGADVLHVTVSVKS